LQAKFTVLFITAIAITLMLCSFGFSTNVNAAPVRVYSSNNYCDGTYDKSGNLAKRVCCHEEFDQAGKLVFKSCETTCYKSNGDAKQCPKNTKMEGTFNPGITGGAGAGVLQDENTGASKNAEIGNNTGIIKEGDGLNNTDNAKQSIGKGDNPLIDKDMLIKGPEASPYIGDSSTWCKIIGGEKVCTCRGGTDCLHCGVYTGSSCTDTSNSAGVLK